ncbi:MAG: FG-GAP repeat domain-containing protein, partial [Planctomycetota bacterium]
DFDGDGFPDHVTATDRSDDESVLPGNGDGTFQDAASFAAGDGPVFVAVADVDGDDFPDLITANLDSNNLSVLLGNGDGTFQAPAFLTAGDGPVSVAVADLDGDNFPDLVTANRDSSNLSVLLGNGDGTFQAPAFLTAGDGPVSVAVADLDDDDFPDLATANHDSNDVSVLLGNGDGTFQAPAFYSTASAPVSITVSRLFGQFQIRVENDDPPPVLLTRRIPDLSPDLVIANRDSNNVAVLLGNGDGSFNAAKYFAAGNAPVSVAVSNLNSDQRLLANPDEPLDGTVSVPIPDIVTANRGGYNVGVLMGRPLPPNDTPVVNFRTDAASAVDRDTRFIKVRQFCTPVDKNGEGIPDSSIYLTCYEARKPWNLRPQVTTTDQFGELEQDVRKQRTQFCLPSELIWVDDSMPTPTPTATPIATPTTAPTLPSHQFELHRVKRTRGAEKFERREVSVEDLFINDSVELKKPVRLGVPTGIEGKGILNSYHHLNCYSLKAPRFKPRFVQMKTDFGALDLAVRKPNMLCTPSLKEVVTEDQ